RIDWAARQGTAKSCAKPSRSASQRSFTVWMGDSVQIRPIRPARRVGLVHPVGSFRLFCKTVGCLYTFVTFPDIAVSVWHIRKLFICNLPGVMAVYYGSYVRCNEIGHAAASPALKMLFERSFSDPRPADLKKCDCLSRNGNSMKKLMINAAGLILGLSLLS